MAYLKPQAQNLRTVRALQEELSHIPISEASLRWKLFKAEQNGLAPAVVKRGGRVYVDRELFRRWLEGEDLEREAG